MTCQADILDFNNPPVGSQDPYGPGFYDPPNATGPTYIEDGFRLATTNAPGDYGSIIRFNPFNQQAPVPSDGTVYFGATYYSNPWLDMTNGSAFSISQIDLADYSA